MPNNAEYEAARLRYLHKVVRVRYPDAGSVTAPGIVIDTKPRELSDGKISVKIQHNASTRPIWWVVDMQERPENWTLEVYRG